MLNLSFDCNQLRFPIAKKQSS